MGNVRLSTTIIDNVNSSLWSYLDEHIVQCPSATNGRRAHPGHPSVSRFDVWCVSVGVGVPYAGVAAHCTGYTTWIPTCARVAWWRRWKMSCYFMWFFKKTDIWGYLWMVCFKWMCLGGQPDKHINCLENSIFTSIATTILVEQTSVCNKTRVCVCLYFEWLFPFLICKCNACNKYSY